MRSLYTVLMTLLCLSFSAQTRVLLDADFEEWQELQITYVDSVGDGGFAGLDLAKFQIFNDDDFLFFYLEVGTEINLQNGNSVTMYIDTDNDLTTGTNSFGIGAELVYDFGDRSGTIYLNGFSQNIEHQNIGLVSSPTVSSDRFEFAIKRDLSFFGTPLFSSSEIKVVIKDHGLAGDQLPSESGGVSFTFLNELLEPLPEYSMVQSQNSDLRVLSYNVLFDSFFESNKFQSYKRILESIDPQVIGFQEIYDHSATQVASKVESMIPSVLNEQWYFAEAGPDIHAISRYPILASTTIEGTSSSQGNGAFLIDLPDVVEDLLFIVAHTPCCGNDAGRQWEVDAIMGFIRDAKNGIGPLQIENNAPIIICGDMNFVGDDQQLETFLTGNIINEAQFGEDFSVDWDGSNLVDAKPYLTELPMTVTWYALESSFSPGRLDFQFYTGSNISAINSYSLFTPSLPLDTLLAYDFETSDVLNASDHLPLVVDYQFTNLTGLDETLAEHYLTLNILRNPVSDKLLLEFSTLNSSNAIIEIRDISGKILERSRLENIEQTLSKTEINVSKYSAGSYIVSLISENYILSKNFVIFK